MRALCLSALTLLLVGCPKQVERVAGSDDARLDDASARLEELRLQDQAEPLSCPERCALARRTCEVTQELCGLVEANPDRTDLPPRCVQAREQCAQVNSHCVRCQER